MKPVNQKLISLFTTVFAVLVFLLLHGRALAYSSEELVNLTNKTRNENGLSSLTINSKLTAAAEMKAKDMIEKDYFSHTSPDGRLPWNFIKSAGYTYVYAGENLGIGFNDPSELHNAWLNSPTHRENIVNTHFKEIGIAVLTGEYQGVETTVAVQMFGSTTKDAVKVEEPVVPEQKKIDNTVEKKQIASQSDKQLEEQKKPELVANNTEKENLQPVDNESSQKNPETEYNISEPRNYFQDNLIIKIVLITLLSGLLISGTVFLYLKQHKIA